MKTTLGFSSRELGYFYPVAVFSCSDIYDCINNIIKELHKTKHLQKTEHDFIGDVGYINIRGTIHKAHCIILCNKETTIRYDLTSMKIQETQKHKLFFEELEEKKDIKEFIL